MSSEAIARRDLEIESAPGIRLAVRHVAAADTPSTKIPVILLHGARVPGIPSFDLDCPDGSLAADLARAGHDVFIMDARGYGGSTRIGQEGDPAEAQILSPSNEVVEDIEAVAQAVRRHTGRQVLGLLGWATGGHWVGMFAARHADPDLKIILYNSLYGAERGHPVLGPGGPLADAEEPDRLDARKLGGFGYSTAESLLPSWDASIPAENKEEWRDPVLLRAYQDAALASDPSSYTRNPPAFRAPNGAMADSFTLAGGHRLWDAGDITAHVLLIRSENDFWSRPGDLTALADELTKAASLRVLELPQATHYVHLDRPEKGRREMCEEVLAFLA